MSNQTNIKTTESLTSQSNTGSLTSQSNTESLTSQSDTTESLTSQSDTESLTSQSDTTESLTSQSDTVITASSSSETNHNDRPIRKETNLWPKVKEYLLSRAELETDPHTVTPRPMCALCDENELDIAGVLATDITSVRFDGAVLPCSHMFCIPCLNEYEDNLPDPNPYDAVYNPVCGRRKLTREYKCPACRADMHHRKCWCEVGACNLPSYDLLDGGVAESGGQWVPKMLHPGERNQEEIEVLEWVDHDPAVMDFETRLKLVELVNAVPTTMPEWEAAVEVGWAAATSENNDDDDDDDDELEQHETITEHQKTSGELNTRPVGITISNDADLNGKIYPIILWNQAITPVCPKCDRERLLRFASAMFPVLEEMPDWFRHRGVQKTEK